MDYKKLLEVVIESWRESEGSLGGFLDQDLTAEEKEELDRIAEEVCAKLDAEHAVT